MFKIINYVFDILIIAYVAYFLIFVFLGLFSKKSSAHKRESNKFAIIIPAHNEEKVIGPLLKNLHSLNYPGNLYDIYVVADNCRDNTAETARSHGANVLVRNNKLKKGKGYALKYAFKKLGFLSNNSNYDASVIFDADNLVEKDFLKVMNTRMQKGEKIIQAFVDSKNASDNWVTATFSMMFWINNRYNLHARNNVGLSAVLMGTGMCISAEVLNKVKWDTTTLTEDLEYSVEALTRGVKTHFAYETKIYDEKPLSFIASCKQRLRWARGQISVAIKYIPRLLKNGFKNKSITMIDGGIRLLQQPFIMFNSFVFILRILFPDVFISPLFNLLIKNINVLAYIMPVLPYLLPSSIFVLDNISYKSIKYLPFFPLFMYSWGVLLYWALFTLNDKSWLPTKHSRDIELDNLLKESG